MLPYTLYVWLIITAAATPDDSQYCTVRYRRLCQGKGTHVACQYPEAGPGLSCENYTKIHFTDELKHFVTHYINRRRQRVAAGNERVRGGIHLPKPRLMMLVEWDRELAFLAQRLADQCNFVHDDCRATVRYPYAGQTVGEVRWRKSSDSDALSALRGIRRVLDAWWGERRRVQPRQLTSPFRLTSRGAVWGHFTQLAVWRLRAVGCGAVRHGQAKPRLLLVCDFSHTNMLGQKTITPGSLDRCPIHTERRPRSQYPLLCGPVRRPSENNGKQYDDDDELEEEEKEETSLRVGLIPQNKIYTSNDYKMKAKMIAATKAVIKDRIEHELAKKKGEHKTHDNHLHTATVTYRERSTKWHYFGKWRESQEATDSAIIVDKIPKTYPGLDQGNVVTEEPTRPIITIVTPARVRWKQTRDRPVRPGVNALLNIQTPIPVAAERRQSMASLVLDKDDVDQLFRDTGFSISSKTVHQNQLSS